MPTSMTALTALPAFSGRGARRHTRQWLDALDAARALPDADLPQQHLPTDGPPPPRVWAERDPAAATRLTAARAAITELARSLDLPVENLLSPDSVRRLCWDPPEDLSQPSIEQVLRGLGARPWQIELTAAALTAALQVATAGLDEADSEA
jgi:ribonuclease D